MTRFNDQDIINIKSEPHLFREFFNSIDAFLNEACQLVITPATANIERADARAGLTKTVSIKMMSNDVTPLQISFAGFTLAASVSDTISDASIVPTIDDSTPTMVKGEATVTLTLPTAAGYQIGETITVTISSLTLPDGRVLTGGTAVYTIIADS